MSQGKQIVGYQVNESALAFYRGRPDPRPADLCERVVMYATPEDAIEALIQAKVREVTESSLDYRTALQAAGKVQDIEKLDQLARAASEGRGREGGL